MRDRLYWIAAAAGIVLALSLLPSGVRYLRGAADSEPARFIASGITTTGAPISLSPDGRWLVTSNGQGAGSRGVNALLLNSVTPQLLIKDNNIVQPFWSPDSKSIGFFEEGKLKRADVASGSVQVLCEAPAPIGGATWGSQGVILFSSNHVLNRVLATGGQSTALTSLNGGKQETEQLAPYFLPDGTHYLFLSLSLQSVLKFNRVLFISRKFLVLKELNLHQLSLRDCLKKIVIS